MWGHPQLSWTKSNDLDAKRTQKAPKIVRYKQHQPAVSCSFYLQIKRMSWKGGSKSTEHNPALALRHLPWLCCFLGALQWHRSCEDRSAVCRWSTASTVVPSQRAPRRLTIACWKSWSTNKSLLYPSLFLFVGAELNDNPLGWVDRDHYQVPVRIASYGEDWNWKGQCKDDMHVRFTCQYQSCAPVALCSQWRGRRGKAYSVSSQSRLIWPSEKSWGGTKLRVNFLLEWPSTDNWGTRKSGRKLGMITHSALDKNLTHCWW